MARTGLAVITSTLIFTHYCNNIAWREIPLCNCALMSWENPSLTSFTAYTVISMVATPMSHSVMPWQS
eukprot:4844653-Ditylum_brightwellii.AAC.1